MNMKNILLDRKWIGAAALVLYVLVVSLFAANFGSKAVKAYAPEAEEEIAAFLPVTFENGEITAPENTVITRKYNGDEFRVVLDTRVDEFEATSLKDSGLYISRKYAYSVGEDKTEIRDFKSVPDATIDSETLHALMTYFQDKAWLYIFGAVFFFGLIYMAAALLLYTVAMHWILSLLSRGEVKFPLTLRVNTLAYILLSALQLVTVINISVVITFVILFAANFGVDKWLEKQNKAV